MPEPLRCSLRITSTKPNLDPRRHPLPSKRDSGCACDSPGTPDSDTKTARPASSARSGH
jgi:hypothetical protein